MDINKKTFFELKLTKKELQTLQIFIKEFKGALSKNGNELEIICEIERLIEKSINLKSIEQDIGDDNQIKSLSSEDIYILDDIYKVRISSVDQKEEESIYRTEKPLLDQDK